MDPSSPPPTPDQQRAPLRTISSVVSSIFFPPVIILTLFNLFSFAMSLSSFCYLSSICDFTYHSPDPSVWISKLFRAFVLIFLKFLSFFFCTEYKLCTLPSEHDIFKELIVH